jgi:hypothetical protein
VSALSISIADARADCYLGSTDGDALFFLKLDRFFFLT